MHVLATNRLENHRRRPTFARNFSRGINSEDEYAFECILFFFLSSPREGNRIIRIVPFLETLELFVPRRMNSFVRRLALRPGNPVCISAIREKEATLVNVERSVKTHKNLAYRSNNLRALGKVKLQPRRESRSTCY